MSPRPIEPGELDRAREAMAARAEAAKRATTPAGDAVVDVRHVYGDLFDPEEAEDLLTVAVESHAHDVMLGEWTLPASMFQLGRNMLAIGVLVERRRWTEGRRDGEAKE